MSGQYGKKIIIYTKIASIRNEEKNITLDNEEIKKLNECYYILKCRQNGNFSCK